MNNKYEFNIQKKIIENQFLNLKNLKNKKADPNNVILNAAAIQDQMLIDMGLKKRKKKTKKIYTTVKENENNKEPIRNVLNKILSNSKKNNFTLDKPFLDYEKEKDYNILNRQKIFLNNLSLAQKIGLNELPKMPLSLNEWRNVEDKTLKREDYKSNCPICLESLRVRDSILLSCSHVFHKNCIINFEKFTQTKKCPICRYHNYESKDYYKDKEYFIKTSTIKIQKSYRGYITRYILFKTILTFNMPKNKHLRSIYSHWKIKELTNKMCMTMQKQIEESKKIITNLEKEVNELKIIENSVKKDLNVNTSDNNIDWITSLNTAKQRLIGEQCSICITILSNKKPLYLLDCTHCFHKNCLDSFEKYDNYYERRCPICRKSNYSKKEIKL